MFSISTSWNAADHDTGKGIIEEIKILGFNQVELNFTLDIKKVKEIVRLKKEGAIKISSVHNYCPIPKRIKPNKASPDCYSLASINKAERKRAVSETKNTINTADLLGARVVILHIGRVNMDRTTKTLIAMYKRGMKDTMEYDRYKAELIEEREAKSRKFLDSALLSLEELSQYANKFNIALGVENRCYFQEIPYIDELDEVLGDFENKNVFYWHDVGHAQTLECIGLVRHFDYLDKFSSRMIGIHLHDVVGTRDHLAPGCGEFDFSKLRPYINETTLKVIEAHSPATAIEIKEGVKHLEKVLEN